jgi:hypothetical protein
MWHWMPADLKEEIALLEMARLGIFASSISRRVIGKMN